MTTAMAAGTERQHSVVFTLPSLPPSVNQIMGPTQSIHTSTPRWEIKTEWKLWRSGMQRYVKVLPITEGSLVRVDMWLFYNWYYKNGRLRKFDSTNLIDFTVNTIKLKQSWDDNVVKYLNMGSSHDPNRPRVVVRLTEVGQSCQQNPNSRLTLIGGQPK